MQLSAAALDLAAGCVGVHLLSNPRVHQLPLPSQNCSFARAQLPSYAVAAGCLQLAMQVTATRAF